jgi:poly(3-hydroxybutyrate) depolymerase
MRGLALLASAALLALTLAGHVAMAAGPDPVEFRDGDLTLKGILYRPDGNGPFPAIVAMHDCGGLFNATGGVGARYRDWEASFRWPPQHGQPIAARAACLALRPISSKKYTPR